MDWMAGLKASINDESPSFFQLATTGLDGAPRNRTAVFRGFEGSALLLVTRSDSAKVREIRRDGRVEICWYFGGSREQYRISATAELVEKGADSPQLRQRLWDALSAKTRHQFTDGSAVGSTIPAQFLPVRVLPTRVTYLDLNTDDFAERTVLDDGGTA
jgi:hypothetical protein